MVLAETAAGGAGLLFLTPLWSEVKRGFFYLTGSIVLLLAGGTAGAASAGYDPKVAGGHLAVWLAIALAGGTLLWLVLMLARLRLPARALGMLTVPLAIAMLFAFARTSNQSVPLSFFQLLAGAIFTGAVLDGLLLGHWYLTDRRLPRGPINRMAWILVGAVVLELAAVVAGGFQPTKKTVAATNSLNPRVHRTDRRVHSTDAQGRAADRGAVGDGLLLPRGDHRIHCRARCEDQVPALTALPAAP